MPLLLFLFVIFYTSISSRNHFLFFPFILRATGINEALHAELEQK